ncbi:MAG: ATP-dependent helicase DinG [Rhodospirillaceae bacterium]|nr:ATP-dependent helicase DinG [Rhodospirillaceae bacterium]
MKGKLQLPDAPVLAAGFAGAAWLDVAGEVSLMAPAEAARRVATSRPIVCHGPAMARRLGVERFACFDLLELFAFTRPARFCLPTPRGLAEALGLPAPDGLEDEAVALHQAMCALLAELGASSPDPRLGRIAWTMARGHWPWGPAVIAALGLEAAGERGSGLDVWQKLPEWQDYAPPPPPGSEPVEPGEARRRLAQLLGEGSEARPQQADYASAVAAAFSPRIAEGEPHFVLAEAGTGVGKTLGYIAPASLWAERNDGTVWISTFTRNLQRQIDGELDRLYPTLSRKSEKSVIRKGRENYLCLLNYQEAAQALQSRPGDAVALGLIARWASATRDGDIAGGDFPGWLVDLIGRARSLGLADRRGECIYSACEHYRKCFIERSIRRARRASIVIANHALTLIQAARAGEGEPDLPTRYVFDEGHHLFDAADSAFAGHLTGQETTELRRWLIGSDSGRMRGLKRRIEDLIGGDAKAPDALQAILEAARGLPGEGWLRRIADSAPSGPTERFLVEVRALVRARAKGADSPHGLEADSAAPPAPLLASATALMAALEALLRPMRELARLLGARLVDEADTLDTPTRQRIEAVTRGLKRRAETEIAGWRDMLAALGHATPPEFVDWFAIPRIDGRDIDIGFYRHWVDPMVPFIASVAQPAHGIVVTSATLTDGRGDEAQDWVGAETRSGGRHLPSTIRARVPSPFDYVAQTRVLIVTDIDKRDPDQVASAYRALFLAAGGGGLGIFTAIERLRAVHRRIAADLDSAGLPLLAQHLDGLDTATLVDIFRAEEDACLLGTDAVRDGVDVPGRSLRLIVFDRVPWPRPTILHRARKAAFGGTDYDDALARLRLKQAFGRLVRRADDRGVFVLLDRQMPSRLAGAFPEGVELRRSGLAEVVAATRDFLARERGAAHAGGRR